MNKIRWAFHIFCVSILLLAVAQIAFMKPARSDDTVPDQAVKEKEKEVEKAKQRNESIAQELENKRLSLESKEHELGDQEGRIKEREKELDKKLAEMEHLRSAVSGELEAQRKNNEERVAKMVSVFETMTPKSASSVLETLDDWLAVEVLKRMDTKRMAKVMNIMDKNRSAKLSELVTGYYRPENEMNRKVSSVKNSEVKPAGQVPAPQPEKVAAAAQQQQPAPKIQKKGGEK